MNLILVSAEELQGNRVQLSDRRLQHLREVHRAAEGELLRVGLIDGPMGSGTLTRLTPALAELELDLDQPPPPPLPLTLLLALPRPKMLKRILQGISALGIKRLILINSYRVEKSYWQSPWLRPEAIREQLILGLEQARDTRLPEVVLEKRFKPFVEDRLPALAAGKRCLLAHPGSHQGAPHRLQEESLLAIGPEGGFIPYEVEKLEQAGFSGVHIGPRIQRVENAIPLIVGKLYDNF
ncbi:16S rRNA (uracil(1498)-N(3))-methyltransferase [Aestuariirhabdus litorea]|uniref:Ribosomal RNA small subunit methyltransferase E n=1 Tax=Aestuariirhabdus litorea TaxID=2528527 RepID=A0A3P3VK73_9GAMM|nr:16S rRNA (uracil(1498)-N(3))-methyltransferase [Aestuariirhabdus litorea]RRJ83132.1 16S rRNA (uracil(1498)-N(3))-methyltransferase [Aestuariirhabdus litorea]RWW93288.1 16S rRNA (uracil(1498)-N(3))-methyltransferase [Endozoicomonadaceae bacterium GTF-13]